MCDSDSDHIHHTSDSDSDYHPSDSSCSFEHWNCKTSKTKNKKCIKTCSATGCQTSASNVNSNNYNKVDNINATCKLVPAISNPGTSDDTKNKAIINSKTYETSDHVSITIFNNNKKYQHHASAGGKSHRNANAR
jgi:hypothetical protein